MQALVDNISSRFSEDDLMSAGAVLDHSTWPQDDENKILYGDKEVVVLAKAVGLSVSACFDYYFVIEIQYVQEIVQLTLCRILHSSQLSGCSRFFYLWNSYSWEKFTDVKTS